jgi:hypothetical protein
MQSIDEHEEAAMTRYFNTEEMGEIEKFFAPFCKTGQIYLSHLFQMAKALKNPPTLQVILAVCQVQWEEVWKHGTPSRIGDTDDTAPNMGLKNAGAFFRVYKTLKIPTPRTL